VRRSLRIFPLYYAALAVTLLVLPSLSQTMAESLQPAVNAQAWLWLYGANVWQSLAGEWGLGPLNHFWSLAIEEHFYLVWPAVICFTSRQTAMRICGGLFGASIVARAVWLASGGNNVAAEVLTPLRMDGLVLGSWLALAARGAGGWQWLVGWARPGLIVFGLAAMAADVAGRRLLGLPYAAWACTCGALLVLVVAAARTSGLGRLGNWQVLRFFGKYSYAMYVFQLPLVYVLAPVMTASGLAAFFGSAWFGQAVYCGMMFGLTTGAALVSWQLFEKRWLELKQRFGG
jgi:peptidoglycan/LPS O-acetylase OafA/YrhL